MNWREYCLKAAFIVVSYIALRNFALYLAPESSVNVVIWPGAAVTFVSVLLWGNRFLPPVFIAGVASGLLFTFGVENDLTAFRIVYSNILLGLGVSLQAWLAVYLVKRFAPLSDQLSSFRDPVSCIVLGAGFGCTVNAILSAFTIHLTGRLELGDFPSFALKWWSADALGVVVFTPLLLVLLKPSISLLRKLIVGLPTVLLTALPIIFYLYERDVSQQLFYRATSLELILIVGLIVSGLLGSLLLPFSRRIEHASIDLNRSTERKKLESFSLFWIPGLVALFGVLLSVFMWQEFQSRERANISQLIEEKGQSLQIAASNTVSFSVSSLKRMAQRWEVADGLEKHVWEDDAKNYVQDQSILVSILLVDKNYLIKWAVPYEPNKVVIGFYIAFEEARKNVLDQSVVENDITVRAPVYLIQGTTVIVVSSPIYKNGNFDGFVMGHYEFNQFFQTLIGEADLDQFFVSFLDGDNVLFETDANAKQYAGNISSRGELGIFDKNWSFLLTPKPSFVNEHYTALPELLLVAGVTISIIVALTVYTSLLSTQKSRVLDDQAMELRENEGRISAILETAPDGIMSVNEQGIITSINAVVTDIFGYSDSELVGHELEKLIPQRYKQHKRDFQQFGKSGASKLMAADRHVVGLRRDGAEIPLEVGLSRTVMPNGSVLLIAAIRDITDRKQAELERENLIDRLTFSNEELERFAYICSHDLQEPLRMVRSFSELLEKDMQETLAEDQKKQQYFGFIIDGAKRAQKLIADLLEYSKHDQVALKTELVETELLIHEIQQNMQLQLKECHGKITHENLPEITGNKTQLLQLFQNLINNGIKYCKPDTKPHVHIDVNDEGDFHHFIVRDNGIGISEQYQSKIFELFQRLHSKGEFSGTGVGLSICKKIVERHGGKIWVESEQDNGAEFHFTIAKNIVDRFAGVVKHLSATSDKTDRIY